MATSSLNVKGIDRSRRVLVAVCDLADQATVHPVREVTRRSSLDDMVEQAEPDVIVTEPGKTQNT